MMQTVSIDSTSLLTTGLIPVHVDIPSPEPKLSYVEIPGKDGKLDVTEFMGDVKFKNIDITIDYESKNSLYSVRTYLKSINGESVSLNISDGSHSETYTGRVKSFSAAQTGSTVAGNIVIDCQPIPEVTTNVSN